MPEVKLKLRELVNKYQSIQKLRDAPKVRAKLAFELSPLAGQITVVVRNFEETRAKLIKDMGEKGKDGNISIPDDKREEFSDQIDELLDAEVVLNAEMANIPANFEMDGLVGIVSDWRQFLALKE